MTDPNFFMRKVFMGLTRSTSDHIAWIFLDPVSIFHPKESFSDMLRAHFEEIIDYATSFVTADDVVVFIPSLGKLKILLILVVRF